MQTLLFILSLCLWQAFAQNTTVIIDTGTNVLDTATAASFASTTTNTLDNETTTTALNCSDPSYHVQIQCVDIQLRGQSSFAQLLLVAIVSALWILYLTFFNSRLIGLIITKVANKFIKGNIFACICDN